MKRKSAFTYVVSTICLVSLYSFSSMAFACTTDGWTSTSGSPVADSPTTVPRVSGLCGMELTAQGSVMDTSPVNESTFIARFYMRGSLNSGTPIVFQAYSDDGGTTEVITVTFDGSNLTFNGGTGNSAAVPVLAGWNLVELAWTANTGMDYWVNTESSEAPTGSTGAANTSIESVALGGITAFDGFLQFDDYVSHRETPIGGLLIGDADKNDAVDVLDILAIVDETDRFNPVLQEGQPDCDMNGSVDVLDILGIVAATDRFNPIPCGQ